MTAGGRLDDRIAMVFGAGQTPGRTIGNGRATALAFAREGARVFAVDRDHAAAQATVDEIGAAGGEAVAFVADVTDEDSVVAAVGACRQRWDRIDVLHNNVGVSMEAGDRPLTDITIEAFDRILAVNLRGMVLTCKHVLPLMRAQGQGAIVNISSAAAYTNYPYVAYKTSKAAVVALTSHIAIRNAEYGVRANVICPGFLNTPMAMEKRMRAWSQSYEELVASRDAEVPLRGGMGTGWDVAWAAVYLASDEARYVTGVTLPVDGGLSVQVGRRPLPAEQREER